jgi:hypothetical protein
MAELLKSRVVKAGPIWKRIYRRKDSFVRVKMVAGASAGQVACAGIKIGDKLVALLYHQASAALQDLTAELIGQGGIKGNGVLAAIDDKYDNTGGTSTAAGTVILIWESYNDVLG